MTMYTLSAGAVIVRQPDREPRYLLLRARDYWDFPKGIVEEGEESLDAAVREIEMCIRDSTSTVGRLRTPYRVARSCCSSLFTLASRNLPRYTPASCCSTGISARQGAHQSAQKSTSTGTERDRSNTSSAKVCAVASKIYRCV